MREDLPTGTVTFVFTDVEGSTRLLDELGVEAYGALLAEHHRVCREAWAAHAGVEIDTAGDAFFVAFSRPSDALAAAAAAQEALASAGVRVRMGVHTGEVALAETGYVGMEVHRAARIAAAGHGGQVLISNETRQLAEVDATDLGEHRLKDFAEPVHIFQLGSERFPPLKTISNTNLPRPASSFVGREREVEDVLSVLTGDSRLVTLTGPGGSGKTRLAIEAAARLVPEFKAGVFWVGLSSISDPGLVTETIAQVLGANDGLADHIGEREQLLLLDNFEQVIEAAPELSSVLEACPYLRLLVTSRELLRIRGEVEYPVPSLADPDAVTLFCARARAVPDESVHELCRALDNLPLALELAAARTSVLTARQILERLAGRLDLLKGGRGVDARHETLRATIAWSHELLDSGEQQLFRRLSVFAGGCSFDSAELVAGANLDTLQSLLDKSLLRRRDSTEGPRFWMLETIRAYALERLEASGEADELRSRHAHWFAAVDERMAVDGRFNEVDWLRLDQDLDNFRAALGELVARDDRESFVRLVKSLVGFWHSRGYIREGTAWSDEAVRVAADLPEWFRANAWEMAAFFALCGHDLDRADELFRRGLEARRADGRENADERAFDVRWLSLIAEWRGDEHEADMLSTRAAEMFRELDDERHMMMVSHDQAIFTMRRGDYGHARSLLDVCVSGMRELGNEEPLASVLLDVGILELRERRYAEAVAPFAECLGCALGCGLRVHVAVSLRGLAAAAAGRGELEPAARLLASADRMLDETGHLMEDYEREAFEDALAPVLDRADEPEIAAAWAAGRAMSEADAAAYALATVAKQTRQL